MEGHSPVPRISVQSYINHDEINKNTELTQIFMQGHSPVPRVSDQAL